MGTLESEAALIARARDGDDRAYADLTLAYGDVSVTEWAAAGSAAAFEEIGDGVTRYEALFPGGAEHHHHLVCDTCGKLIPFVDDELERAIRKIARRTDFSLSDHDVTLHGICADCGS